MHNNMAWTCRVQIIAITKPFIAVFMDALNHW